MLALLVPNINDQFLDTALCLAVLTTKTMNRSACMSAIILKPPKGPAITR